MVNRCICPMTSSSWKCFVKLTCSCGQAGMPRPLLTLRSYSLVKNLINIVYWNTLTFGQYADYNLLSSITYQSFPSDLYSSQYLVTFSEFCRSRNRSASPVSADWKTGFNVGLTRQPRSGGTALHGMVWRHRLESDPKRTNDGCRVPR
jgi:hypothetical protein